MDIGYKSAVFVDMRSVEQNVHIVSNDYFKTIVLTINNVYCVYRVHLTMPTEFK